MPAVAAIPAIFGAIGTAVGATAATAVVTGVAVTATAVAAGATVYSTVQQKRAADAAARNSSAIGGYNAKVNQQESDQIDLNARENVRILRKDAATFMSRQASTYARAGVVANSGSALAVQVATAGRTAIQQQQLWTDAQARENRLASASIAGIYDAGAKADAYHSAGTAAVMGGAAKLATQIGGAAEAGYFGGPSTTVGSGTNDLSAGLKNGKGPV